MNSPTCRARNVNGHICTDKFGGRWDRGDVGPRPHTDCFFETMAAGDEQRAAWRKTIDDLTAEFRRDLDELTSLEQIQALDDAVRAEETR